MLSIIAEMGQTIASAAIDAVPPAAAPPPVIEINSANVNAELKKKIAASLVKFDDDSVYAVPMTRTLVVSGGDVQISVSKNGALAPPSGGTELKEIATVKINRHGHPV